MRFLSMYLLGLISIGSNSVAAGQEKVLVQDPAAFEENSPIAQVDRLECSVAQRLAASVLERVRERYANAVSSQDISNTRSEWGLGLVITNLNGVGNGGPHAGPKYGYWAVTVRAELYRDSRLVAYKSIKRATVMGQGTCPNTERIVKVLGKDVADWVEAEIKTRPLVDRTSNREEKHELVSRRTQE